MEEPSGRSGGETRDSRGRGLTAHGRDVIYGVHAVREALRNRDRAFDRVLLAQGRGQQAISEILELAASRGVAVERVERATLTEMSGTSHHQGVAGIAAKVRCLDLTELLERLRQVETPALIVTDGVEDPANLGAIMRSAEVMGFNGLVVPERRAVGVTPAVVRASAGAAEYLPIARVVNVVRAIKRLKEEGFWVVGLEAASPVRCFDANLLGRIAIVVGSEGKGIRRLVQEECDVLVAVPVQGRVPSLNVAAAAAVAMYEVMRQRARGTVGGMVGEGACEGEGRGMPKEGG